MSTWQSMRNGNGKRLEALALAVLFPLITIIPPAPRGIGVLEVSYALIAGAILIGWAARVVRKRKEALPPRSLVLPIVALLALLTLSFAWAVLAGTSIPSWFRGIVPFVSLALLFPARSALRDVAARQIVVGGFLASALLVAAQIFAAALPLLPSALAADDTMLLREALPDHSFGAVLVAGTAYALGMTLLVPAYRRIHALLLAVLMAAVFLTFLRGLLLIYAALTILAIGLLLARHHRPGIPSAVTHWQWSWRRAAALTGAIVATSWILLGTPAGAIAATVINGYLDRFGSILVPGGSNARLAELEAVFEQFLASPIIGYGPGYEYSYIRPESGVTWTGPYTHNMLTYMLLIGGLVGFAVGSWLLAAFARIAWQAQKRLRAFGGYAFALYALFAYAMLQATYRTVGFWLTVAVLVAILACGVSENALKASVTRVPSDPNRSR